MRGASYYKKKNEKGGKRSSSLAIPPPKPQPSREAAEIQTQYQLTEKERAAN